MKKSQSVSHFNEWLPRFCAAKEDFVEPDSTDLTKEDGLARLWGPDNFFLPRQYEKNTGENT